MHRLGLSCVCSCVPQVGEDASKGGGKGGGGKGGGWGGGKGGGYEGGYGGRGRGGDYGDGRGGGGYAGSGRACVFPVEVWAANAADVAALWKACENSRAPTTSWKRDFEPLSHGILARAFEEWGSMPSAALDFAAMVLHEAAGFIAERRSAHGYGASAAIDVTRPFIRPLLRAYRKRAHELHETATRGETVHGSADATAMTDDGDGAEAVMAEAAIEWAVTQAMTDPPLPPPDSRSRPAGGRPATVALPVLPRLFGIVEQMAEAYDHDEEAHPLGGGLSAAWAALPSVRRRRLPAGPPARVCASAHAFAPPLAHHPSRLRATSRRAPIHMHRCDAGGTRHSPRRRSSRAPSNSCWCAPSRSAA